MHWKAHLLRHFRLFQTFPEFFSQTLSPPCLLLKRLGLLQKKSMLCFLFSNTVYTQFEALLYGLKVAIYLIFSDGLARLTRDVRVQILISNFRLFFALHKTPFSHFYCTEKQIFSGISDYVWLFLTFSHRRSQYILDKIDSSTVCAKSAYF